MYVQLILKKLAVQINVRERWLTREGKMEKKFLTREKTWCPESLEILDVLLYYHQNDVTVKEELVQLRDIFKLIEDINQ